MSIRLKDLKDVFRVVETPEFNTDNMTSYNLYDPDKNSGKVQVFKFLGNILFNSKRQIVSFNNNEYNCVDELKASLYEWANSLPFCSDYYDPIYRTGVKEGYCIRDYMKSIGFDVKYAGQLNSDKFILKGFDPFFGNVYMNLSVTVDEDATSGTIMQHSNISGDYRWVEEKFTDLDSAIEKINSLVAAQLLCSSAWAVNNLEKLNSCRGNLEGNYKKFDVDSFTEYTAKTKDIIIAKLESALEMLKN